MFKEDIKIGKGGEKRFKALMEGLGVHIDDVTGDTKYRKEDIDFVASFGGWEKTVEVKTDTAPARYKNILVETCANDNKNAPGWIFCTKSDVIALYKTKTDLMYLIERKTLLELVNEQIIDYKNYKGGYKLYISANNPTYRSYNMIIPLADIRRRGGIRKIYKVGSGKQIWNRKNEEAA